MNFNNASFEAAFGTSKQLVESNLPEVAFSGRSNVGKSSLLNKILNRKSLARVSSQPGKTATINFFKLDNARLVDLPGYGYAKVSLAEKKRWSELVEGYFSSQRNIKLVIQLVDMRHSPTKDDLDMIHFLLEQRFPFIIAMTKCDKLNKTETEKRLALINDELDFLEGHIPIIPFSSVKGTGVEEIKKYIEMAVSN